VRSAGIMDHGKIIASGVQPPLAVTEEAVLSCQRPSPQTGDAVPTRKSDRRKMHTQDVNAAVARLLQVGASLAWLRFASPT